MQEKSSEGGPITNLVLMIPPKHEPEECQQPWGGLQPAAMDQIQIPNSSLFSSGTFPYKSVLLPSVSAGVRTDPCGQGDEAVGSHCC